MKSSRNYENKSENNPRPSSIKYLFDGFILFHVSKKFMEKLEVRLISRLFLDDRSSAEAVRNIYFQRDNKK